MVLSTRLEPPDLFTATLRGLVTPNDHSNVVRCVRDAIARAGSVRVLIVLDAFGGWVPDPSMYSAESWLADNEMVSRIAVVGRAEWRRSVLTLIAQPIRRWPIRYFDTECEARRWLGVEPFEEPEVGPK